MKDFLVSDLLQFQLADGRAFSRKGSRFESINPPTRQER